MKSPKIRIDRLSVVGLGKLGLCLALSFASRGIQVVGVDIDSSLVNLLRKVRAPWYEPELEAFLKKYRKNMQVTTKHERAIAETDITIVLVPTPSDSYGKFSNKYVEKALKDLASKLKDSDKDYHLIVLSSTVMPGSIVNRLVPIIEKETGRKFGKEFGFSYVPDFVALGNVIDDFLNADFVLIGSKDSLSGSLTEKIYRKLVKRGTPIRKLGFTEAELAKVALNLLYNNKNKLRK